MLRRRLFFALALAALHLLCCNATAQTNAVEVATNASFHHLTNDFPSWAGVQFRIVVKRESGDAWNFEIARQREFNDDGSYFSTSYTHNIGQDWYVSGAVGTSVGGFFYPSARFDAQVNKKWLAKRSLVTTLGLGYFDAKDAHRDTSLFVGGIYYFDAPWIVQAGVRWNRSTPGSVISRSQFVALTEGREGSHYIVLRGQFGREAYQPLAPGAALVDFPSRVGSITWKQWLGPSWGINTMGEFYSGRVYRRMGANVGVFKSF